MTNTITKRADELKPGDVVIFDGKGPSSFLYGQRGKLDDFASCTFGRHSTGGVFVVEIHPGDTFRVESPALTPAQQHAEEMVELLRSIQERVVDPTALIPHRVGQLLAKIDPPAPPTLEEALELLAQLSRGHSVDRHEKAEALLDRARRSGVMK